MPARRATERDEGRVAAWRKGGRPVVKDGERPGCLLANLAKQGIDELAALVRARLKHLQYRRCLLGDHVAGTGIDFDP